MTSPIRKCWCYDLLYFGILDGLVAIISGWLSDTFTISDTCLYGARNPKVKIFFQFTHGLRTPNEGINQRNLKICFGRTYKFGIGIWFSAVQWRWFPHRASVVREFPIQIWQVKCNKYLTCIISIQLEISIIWLGWIKFWVGLDQ